MCVPTMHDLCGLNLAYFQARHVHHLRTASAKALPLCRTRMAQNETSFRSWMCLLYLYDILFNIIYTYIMFNLAIVYRQRPAINVGVPSVPNLLWAMPYNCIWRPTSEHSPHWIFKRLNKKKGPEQTSFTTFCKLCIFPTVPPSSGNQSGSTGDIGIFMEYLWNIYGIFMESYSYYLIMEYWNIMEYLWNINYGIFWVKLIVTLMMTSLALPRIDPDNRSPWCTPSTPRPPHGSRECKPISQALHAMVLVSWNPTANRSNTFPYPIGSMVLLYMVAWIPSIYPQC